MKGHVWESHPSFGRPSPHPAPAACPDCAAPVMAGRVFHADSCPMLAALERATATDALWFRRNKGRRQRVRATTPAERTEMALIWPDIKPDREVTLVRQSRGRYLRRFVPSGMADLLLVSGE